MPALQIPNHLPAVVYPSRRNARMQLPTESIERSGFIPMNAMNFQMLTTEQNSPHRRQFLPVTTS